MTSTRTRTILAALLMPLSLLGLMVVAVMIFFISLPDVRAMRGCMTTSMNQVRLCPGDAQYVPINAIAPELVDAVVASEDASFFHHGGFDWHEISESLTTNLRQAGYKRGGSTITQQLAKNVFLSKEKSILRKLREAALTVAIERNFTKREILERYLNVVEFGENLYGVGPASRHYFGKAAADLHVLEAAFLAFLLPNPKGYSKSFKDGRLTPFARKSVSQIVRRLGGFRKITPDAMNAALSRLDEFPWRGLSRSAINQSTAFDESVPSADRLQEVIESEPAEAATIGPDSSESKSEESSAWD